MSGFVASSEECDWGNDHSGVDSGVEDVKIVDAVNRFQRVLAPV